MRELRVDEHAEELFACTVKDASLGRMTEPARAQCVDLASQRLCPRFGVEQVKDNGSVKLRKDAGKLLLEFTELLQVKRLEASGLTERPITSCQGVRGLSSAHP